MCHSGWKHDIEAFGRYMHERTDPATDMTDMDVTATTEEALFAAPFHQDLELSSRLDRSHQLLVIGCSTRYTMRAINLALALPSSRKYTKKCGNRGCVCLKSTSHPSSFIRKRSPL